MYRIILRAKTFKFWLQTVEVDSNPRNVRRIFHWGFYYCRNNWINSHADSNNSIECLSNDSGTNWSPQLQKRFEFLVYCFSLTQLFFVFRTSPVLVPSHAGGNGHHRQRLESTSSMSVGSWQMISGTGSLRSQDSNIVVINEQHQHHQCINNNNLFNSQAPPHPQMCSNHPSANGGSTQTSTLIDEDCFTANDYFMRRERLNAVRTLFYNCYSSTIGYKFKNGTEPATLGSLLGNFAEKVGLTQRTSV